MTMKDRNLSPDIPSELPPTCEVCNDECVGCSRRDGPTAFDCGGCDHACCGFCAVMKEHMKLERRREGGRSVEVAIASNGYVIKLTTPNAMMGGKSVSTYVARDFYELIQILWNGFHPLPIGEKCPYLREVQDDGGD